MGNNKSTAVDLARIEKKKYDINQEEKRRIYIKEMYTIYQKFAENFIEHIRQDDLPKLIVNAGGEGRISININYISKYDIKIPALCKAENITLHQCLHYAKHDKLYYYHSALIDKISENLYKIILDDVKKHGITSVEIVDYGKYASSDSYHYRIFLYW